MTQRLNNRDGRVSMNSSDDQTCGNNCDKWITPDVLYQFAGSHLWCFEGCSRLLTGGLFGHLIHYFWRQNKGSFSDPQDL